VLIGGSLALFAFRASALAPGGFFQPISREGSLVLNNLFLSTATATVLIGTLYPLVLESITGDKISVGAPFFNLTFIPLIVPLLIAVPFGPLLAWKRGDVFAAAQRLYFAFGAALFVTIISFFFIDGTSVLAAAGIGLSAWLILGALTDLALKSNLGRAPVGTSLRRLLGLPLSMHGTALAHLGLGLTTLGIVAVTALEKEHILMMSPGQTQEVAGYQLRFEGLAPFTGPNFTEDQGRFTIIGANGRELGAIVPSKRIYTARQFPTTEAGIRTFGLSQLYIALGDENGQGGVVVRIWWKPLVLLIWLGTVVMMAGGVFSLLDRRLRVGAPAKRREKVAAQPKPAGATT
jgi:cytochrome c-type biogenesis protein CcmF